MRSRLLAAVLVVLGAGLPAAAAGSGAAAVSPPPPDAAFSYQIGGAFRPPAGVLIVDRDWQAPPAKGAYGICYVNAFQAQPETLPWSERQHPSLLLRRGGRPVIDTGWNEQLLDTSSPAKRRAIAAIVGGWIESCARAGYRAVEPDNLDSFTRSQGALTPADNLALARLLILRAHSLGLAVAQKNAAELAASGRRLGFDFAIAEECQRYRECGSYLAEYGDHVLEVEYPDAGGVPNFESACRSRGARISIVYRDRDVLPAGRPGFVERRCQTVARAAAVRDRKRGIASARYLRSGGAPLTRIGAAWAYDWSASAPRPGGPPWVPMAWGSGSVTRSTLAALRAAHRSGTARELLGFNEPDSRAQANMTPQRAAALWPALERTGLRLGSPAPAVPLDGWLARFMALARTRHLRVDFIALHYYQDFTDPHAVEALRHELVVIHGEFHRPIWITELGAIDIRAWHERMLHRPSQAAADRYMRSAFAMLDSLPFVERYAWFTDDCWSYRECRYGSLFTSTGRLTAAGRTYATAP